MKHRADALQIERPGPQQTGGRHAVTRKEKVPGKAPGQAPAKAPAEATAEAAELAPAEVRDPAEGAARSPGRSRGRSRGLSLGKRGPKAGRSRGKARAESPEVAPVEPVWPPARSTTRSPLEPRPASAVLETEQAHHPAAAAEAPTAAERAASPLASTGKWRSRSTLRSLTFVLLVAAAGATGLAARYYFESTTTSRMRLLITASLVVAGLWALLTATAPQVVTLKGSVLTVKSRRGTDRFDLAEGMTQLELIGVPSSSKWALVLHRGDNTVVRLGRRDVDARTLDPLVRTFREIAERRRSEHWARLGL